jgi:hypothetical protein
MQKKPYPGYLAETEIAAWGCFFGLCFILPFWILIPLAGFMVLSFSVAYIAMQLDPDEIVFREYEKHFEPNYRDPKQVNKPSRPWGDMEPVKPKPSPMQIPQTGGRIVDEAAGTVEWDVPKI